MRDSNTISVFDSLKSTIEKYQYNKGEWIKREKINYIDSVKSNEIVVVVEEEVIFPNYNPIVNDTCNSKIKCEYCGNHNKIENQTCYSCGANLK